MNNGNGRPFGQHLLIVGLGTLFATVVISLVAETVVRQMAQIWLALFLLVLIVLIGVVFDVVGTAAAAAREAPLNAKAAKRVFGAQHGVFLLKNRDKVANFTQDVIGDITGIIAGALGISLVFQVAKLRPEIEDLYFNVLVTAMIAAAIVTGKAYGKRVAVEKAEGIIFLAGKVLAGTEKLRFWRPGPNNRAAKSRYTKD